MNEIETVAIAYGGEYDFTTGKIFTLAGWERPFLNCSSADWSTSSARLLP